MVDNEALAAAYQSGYDAAYKDAQEHIQTEVARFASRLVMVPVQNREEEEVTMEKIKFKQVRSDMRVRVERGKGKGHVAAEFTVGDVYHDKKYGWFDSADGGMIAVHKDEKPTIYLMKENA